MFLFKVAISLHPFKPKTLWNPKLPRKKQLKLLCTLLKQYYNTSASKGRVYYWITCIQMRLFWQNVPFFAMYAFIAWVLELKRTVASLMGSAPATPPGLKTRKNQHFETIIKSRSLYQGIKKNSPSICSLCCLFLEVSRL